MNVEQNNASLVLNRTILYCLREFQKWDFAFYNKSQIPFFIIIVKISLPLGYEFFLCLSKSPHLKH